MRRYATIDDIEARWRELTDAEATKAQALIEDATAMVFEMGAIDDGSPSRFSVIKATIANMVIRALSSAGTMPGINQYSQSVGAVSESWQMANPTCDLYLTRQEKKALHIGSSGVWFGGVRRGNAESGCCMHCVD